MKTAVPTLGLLLFAVSCSSAPPPQIAPLPTPPDRFVNAPDSPENPGDSKNDSLGDVSIEAMSLDAWWRDFEDPRLEALLEEGLAANPDLAAVAARVAAANAGARVAGADRKPQASAGFSAARRQQVFVGLPIPGNSGPLTSTSSSFGLNFDLSWEVDLWGRLADRAGAAVADARAAAIELEGAKLSLVGQTAKGWFALAEAEQSVALAEATVETRRRTRERIERRFRSGLRTGLDLRLARSAEAASEAALLGRREAREALRRRVELLLGRYPSGTLATAESDLAELPDLGRPLAAVPLGLPAALLQRRPDLAAQEQRIEAAGLRLAEARKNLYPQIRLTAGGGTASDSLGDLLDSDFSVWSLASNLLQPLFQGGRLRANVERNSALVEETAASFAATLLRAFGEVEAALAAERFAVERLAALDRSRQEARGAQNRAEERYAAGLLDTLTVLDTQRQTLDAESRWLEANRQRLEARVDLYLALGGGFSNQASPVAELAEAAEVAPPSEKTSTQTLAETDR